MRSQEEGKVLKMGHRNYISGQRFGEEGTQIRTMSTLSVAQSRHEYPEVFGVGRKEDGYAMRKTVQCLSLLRYVFTDK